MFEGIFFCQTPRNASLLGVCLRAMLVNQESDSVQCQSTQSPTLRSLSQRKDTYFANISEKTNLSAKPFQPVYQGPRWVQFMKYKKAEKSRDTATFKRMCFLITQKKSLPGICKNPLRIYTNLSRIFQRISWNLEEKSSKNL